MAGFRTHITVSTALGIGYGVAGHWYFDMPPAACLLSAGLCSVSGMLPDVDSDSGVPLRESLAFAASIVPMLLLDRLQHLGLSPEAMVLVGAFVYLFIRFGLGSLLKSYTVHRGMFHSIPAMLIFGELTYLVCFNYDERVRYYKAFAVMLGFLSHLVLDELWAIQWTGWRFKFKKSFGTALKIWGDSLWANVSTYGKLALLTYVLMNDEAWMLRLESRPLGHMAGSQTDVVSDGANPDDGVAPLDAPADELSEPEGRPNVSIRIPPETPGRYRR
jgi:membrane-bound metal-dependent hydrolase YbcI (DUF457 family)